MLSVFGSHSLAQEQEDDRVTTANHQLAARFAPYKMDRLIYSTTVTPHWIEGSDRFWYEWETSNGSSFYLVDPVQGSKTPIFDNDRIAAELTRLTKDPWDGQHLPIRGIRFIDEDTLQFEVESSQDEPAGETAADDVEDDQQQEQDDDGDDEEKSAKKHVFHFEYDVATRTLRQLEDWEGPDNHPDWASVSPDGATGRPRTLAFSGGTEAMDETAQGPWLDLVTRMGFGYLMASVNFLDEAEYDLYRLEEERQGRVHLAVIRPRPVRPGG